MDEDGYRNGAGQVQSKTWSKPPYGWIKINIDAACQQHSEFVGVGCVIRDDQGQFLRARSSIVRRRGHAREADAISLREALSWVKDWRTTKCIFDSDVKLLVDALHGQRGKSIFDTIVEDCQELVKHFQEVLFVFVNRSANMVAHLLAQEAYSSSGPQEWLYIAHDFIACNLIMEEV